MTISEEFFQYFNCGRSVQFLSQCQFAPIDKSNRWSLRLRKNDALVLSYTPDCSPRLANNSVSSPIAVCPPARKPSEFLLPSARPPLGLVGVMGATSFSFAKNKLPNNTDCPSSNTCSQPVPSVVLSLIHI